MKIQQFNPKSRACADPIAHPTTEKKTPSDKKLLARNNEDYKRRRRRVITGPTRRLGRARARSRAFPRRARAGISGGNLGIFKNILWRIRYLPSAFFKNGVLLAALIGQRAVFMTVHEDFDLG